MISSRRNGPPEEITASGSGEPREAMEPPTVFAFL
jgi:hypothetical protein